MAKKPEKDVKHMIVLKALALAQRQGWAQVTLAGIAREAGLSLPDLFDVIDDKTDILALLGRQIDRRVLAAAEVPDPDIAPRDRLFDILMERYDILNDYRGGLVAILEAWRVEPQQAVIACPHLCRSMSWMLAAAGIDTGGGRGAVKIAGLTGIYLKNLRVWKDDDSADLAKVMAALDKDLGRAAQFAGIFGL